MLQDRTIRTTVTTGQLLRSTAGLLTLILAAALNFEVASAQLPEGWLTGPKLTQQLESQVGVQWSGQTLRAALDSLAKTQHVAYLLDRRLDPGSPVELSARDVPLADVYQKLAEQASQPAGVAVLSSVIYLGPKAAADELRTLAELLRDQANKTPAPARSRLLRSAPWRSPELSTPKELLTGLAAEAKLALRGLERVPHDLWPAIDLPPLGWTDRVTLLTAGFGLTARIAADGESLELVPIEPPVRIVRSYPAGSDPAKLTKKLAELAPNAEFKVSAGKLFVRGRWEEQEQIASTLAGKSPAKSTSKLPRKKDPESDEKPIAKQPAGGTSKPKPGTQVFSLNVQNKPLRPVMEQLARQLQLTLKYDEAALRQANISLDARVSFEVRNVPLDDLLRAALAPAKLTFRRDAQEVTIMPE